MSTVISTGDISNKHVSELMTNVPNYRDNHPLWRDHDTRNLQKVSYGGVQRSNWTPNLAENNPNGLFDKIASRLPRRQGHRVIASVLPGKTWSESSFDLPERRRVIQIDVPNSTTKTSTYSYNAYSNPGVTGPNLRTALHGIDTVGKAVLHGRFKELNEESQVTKTAKVVNKLSHNQTLGNFTNSTLTNSTKTSSKRISPQTSKKNNQTSTAPAKKAASAPTTKKSEISKTSNQVTVNKKTTNANIAQVAKKGESKTYTQKTEIKKLTPLTDQVKQAASEALEQAKKLEREAAKLTDPNLASGNLAIPIEMKNKRENNTLILNNN